MLTKFWQPAAIKVKLPKENMKIGRAFAGPIFCYVILALVCLTGLQNPHLGPQCKREAKYDVRHEKYG